MWASSAIRTGLGKSTASSSPSRRANAGGPTARSMTHMFEVRCRENRIEHRLTKVKHPWTNGQVERMNRNIKEATLKRYHYGPAPSWGASSLRRIRNGSLTFHLGFKALTE